MLRGHINGLIAFTRLDGPDRRERCKFELSRLIRGKTRPAFERHFSRVEQSTLCTNHKRRPGCVLLQEPAVWRTS